MSIPDTLEPIIDYMRELEEFQRGLEFYYGELETAINPEALDRIPFMDRYHSPHTVDKILKELSALVAPFLKETDISYPKELNMCIWQTRQVEYAGEGVA